MIKSVIVNLGKLFTLVGFNSFNFCTLGLVINMKLGCCERGLALLLTLFLYDKLRLYRVAYEFEQIKE